MKNKFNRKIVEKIFLAEHKEVIIFTEKYTKGYILKSENKKLFYKDCIQYFWFSKGDIQETIIKYKDILKFKVKGN